MRKVSIKHLYHHISQELKDLPFVVTKRGVPVAIVQGLDQSLDLGQGLDQEQGEKSRPKAKCAPTVTHLVGSGEAESKTTSSHVVLDKLPAPDPFFKPMSKSKQVGKKKGKSRAGSA